MHISVYIFNYIGCNRINFRKVKEIVKYYKRNGRIGKPGAASYETRNMRGRSM